MRTAEQINKYRERKHPKYGSTDAEGMNGFFIIPMSQTLHGVKRFAMCMVSEGNEEVPWEHVSARIAEVKGSSDHDCTPTWEEMCILKKLFWDDEECVMQLHPPQSEYVNCHPNVLHLWKPKRSIIPRPPQIAV